MIAERLAERIEEYGKALSQLEKAAALPKDEFLRDSVIQRFEFIHERAWKMLKLKLELEGIGVQTPRATLPEALQAGLVKDGNRWSDLQAMRNLTSHTYKEQLADDVYDFVLKTGLGLFRELAAKSVTWQAKA